MGVYDSLDRYTQTALLQTALNAARDDVDKREGSIIYDALAPLAFVAGKLIEVLKGVAENADIQTAQGENLDWAASQFGIYRNEAVASVREAQATPQDVVFATGDTFKTEGGLGLVWECTEVLTDGKIVLQCQTPGADGGADYGQLTPQGTADGLRSLVFTETRNPGKDAETDAAFRIRFWKELQRESYGGNFADYQRWLFVAFAQQPNGAALKAVSIFPAWDGGGTIKIVPYIEAEGEALAMPNAATIDALKEFLDPEPAEGKGAGVAPIGHSVTVEAPVFEVWTIAAQVRLKPGQTEISQEDADEAAADVKAAIEAAALECVTKAEDGYPSEAQYTFIFTESLMNSAIVGRNESPRFLGAYNITIGGVPFTAASNPQTAGSHIMPKFGELTLTIYEEAQT